MQSCLEASPFRLRETGPHLPILGSVPGPPGSPGSCSRPLPSSCLSTKWPHVGLLLVPRVCCSALCLPPKTGAAL